MTKFSKLLRSLLAFVLVIASILPFCTFSFAVSNNSEGDIAEGLTDVTDKEATDSALTEEQQLENLANQTLYGDDAVIITAEEKPETKAKNYTDYIFLSLNIGDKSRNFGWQVLSDTSYKYGLGGTEADSTGYFAANAQGTHAAYYKGTDPALFMPIENTDRARNKLGGYTVKSGDIAQVGIYTMNENATDGIVENGTKTFRSYFNLWTSTSGNEYASGSYAYLKRSTGRQIAQFTISSAHKDSVVYGVRWDPIQPNKDDTDTSDDQGFHSTNGVLIYTDFIYVGPTKYKPVMVEYANASGTAYGGIGTGYVGHSTKPFFRNHGKTTSEDTTNNTQTIWGWAVYNKDSAGNWTNSKQFLIDPSTSYTCTQDVQFRLTSVTIPLVKLVSEQEPKNGDSSEDDKYVISLDAFDSAQIVDGKFGEPIDFSILMDRSGSMGDLVSYRSFDDDGKNSTVGTINQYLNTLDKSKWEGYYRVLAWCQNRSSHPELSAKNQKAEYFTYTMPLRYNRDKAAKSNDSDLASNWEVLYLDDSCNCNGTYSKGTYLSTYGIYVWNDSGLDFCDHVKWMSVSSAFALFKKYRNNTNSTWGTSFGTYFKIGTSRMGKQQGAVETLLQKIYNSSSNLPNGVYNTVSIVGYGHTVYIKGYPYFTRTGDVTDKANYKSINVDLGVTYKSKECSVSNYEYMLQTVRNSYVYGQTCVDGAVRLLSGQRSYPEQYAGKSGATQTATDYLPSKTSGRKRVVIVITDGTPTMGTSSLFDAKAATSCIAGAKKLKDAGVTIYTISIDTAVKDLWTEDATKTKAKSYNPSYHGGVDTGKEENKPWLTNNLLHLVSSNYPKATGYPASKESSEVAKTGSKSSEAYTFQDASDASDITTALNKIWSDKAPQLTSSGMSGVASLWLYEEFGREWKLDTTLGKTINVYAEPYLGKGAYGEKILIGTHPITEEVKSETKDGEGTETQVNVLIDPTLTQTMSGDGYQLTIAPTTDQGFTATLKWSDAKKSFLRENSVETGYVATSKEEGKTLDGTKGYKLVLEIPVEVNRENTIGGNNIPLTKITGGFFKAKDKSDNAKGDLINGYTPPNANVSYEITGEDFDYFMTMEEYMKAHPGDTTAGGDAATIENIYNNLVTFPEDPEAENGIKLVNAQGRSRLDYVRVDYTIKTEENALVYQKSAAQKATAYTVPTDNRVSMNSALEKDTSFNAAATITPATNNTDSFGRVPYAPEVAELNPNLYVPKFVVVDFDAQASVGLQREAEIIDLNAANTGKNGAFTVTGTGTSAEGRVDYNFRETHSDTTEVKHMLEVIETIPYTVNAKNPTKDGETVIAREAYILPGNVISYDDTLFGFHAEAVVDETATDPVAGKWVRLGTYGNDVQLPENKQAHGYDKNFATTGDYHGASTVARVGATNPDVAPMIFEFFGTGFELLSRTAPDSGTVVVEIFKAKADGTYGAVADKGYLVDTYLASKTLYQIPIVQFLSEEAPAKYKVHVIPVYDMIFDHGKKGFTPITEEQARAVAGFDESVDFTFIPSPSVAPATRGYEPAGAYNVYVDGCRVYNTLVEDAQGIRDYVYSLAGEQDANILNINDQIVDVSMKVNWTNNTEISGMLFIEAPQKADSDVEGDTGSDETITNTTHGYCLGMNGSLNEEADPGDNNKFYVRTPDLEYVYHDEYKTKIYYRISPEGRTMFYCTDSTGAEVRLTEAEIRKYVGNGEEIVYYSSAYKAIGPAKEVYLSKGQGVAFMVNGNGARVFMSMKTVDGNAVTVQAYKDSAFVDIPLLTGYCSDTEMYFDLTDYVSGDMIMIKNAGDGILSLCNLKTASANGTLEPMINSRMIRLAMQAFRGETELPAVDENVVIRHSLNLQSDISVNLIVPATALEGYDRYVMECTAAGKTFYPAAEVKNGLVYFTVDGLMATQMNENIHSVLHLIKGEETFTSVEDDYSVACYAYTTLNKPEATDSIKTLCANLLRYGSLAQIYKNYQTDALADEEMTEEHKSYLTHMDTVAFGSNNRLLGDVADPGVTWFGKSMILDSKVTVVYVLNTNGYEGNLEDLRLRVTYETIDGTTVELELEDLQVYNEAAGLYSFKLDTLLAAELRAVVSAAVYSGETQVSETLCYSADTYGNGKTGTLAELCKALFAYSDSARAFFAN